MYIFEAILNFKNFRVYISFPENFTKKIQKKHDLYNFGISLVTYFSND